GGWTSHVILTNPTDTTLNGQVAFLSSGSSTAAATPLSMSVNGVTRTSSFYSIPPRSAIRLVTGNVGGAIQIGSVRVTPANSSAPAVAAILRFTTHPRLPLTHLTLST